MSSVILASFSSPMNKEGAIIKPDVDGYYCDVNLGALNTENTSGVFYRATPDVLDLFKKDSFAVKKVLEKQLFGELDHPKETEEMKKERKETGKQTKWLERQLTLQFDNLAMHIRSFRLVETDIVDARTGLKKILIKGDIKPHGKHKEVIKDALTNPFINVAFSIRSLAMERAVAGRMERRIIVLITWDCVISSGIAGSTDHGTMGYELDVSDIESIKLMMSEISENANEDGNDVRSVLDGLICELKHNNKSANIHDTDW